MCILCDSLAGTHHPSDEPHKDYKKHGDGINDPNLVIDYDPLFSSVLGTGVNRRELLKWGGLGALAGLMPTSRHLCPGKEVGSRRSASDILPITDAAALLVAHEMGFFKKEGLESAPPTLIRGWSPLVEAFSSHSFNLAHLLIPVPIWMRYGNKFPIKITAWNHTNGSGIVVGKDSGINSPKDFGGKQFAVPFWYSIHNIISQKIMRDAGITPVIKPQDAKLAPNECNFIVLQPARHAAGAGRQVDRRLLRGGALQRAGRSPRRRQDAAHDRRRLEGPPLLRGGDA
jgi:NitT/TauT family transport system substrate-binding protein